MCKPCLRHWNNALRTFSVALLAAPLAAFAHPDSNEGDTQTHRTDDAVNTAPWETRALPNFRVRFKLPPGYREKQCAIVIGSANITTFQLGHENQIDFTVEDVADANPENAKVGLQKDYIDYKELNQLIGGHKGIVQTFQGGGVVIDEEGKRLPYQVEVSCAVDAKHILRIRAMLGNRERQQEGSGNAEHNRILLIRKTHIEMGRRAI